jgi:hypothetical protein
MVNETKLMWKWTWPPLRCYLVPAYVWSDK